MDNLIKAADFIKHLKKEGLVIISKKEFEKKNARNLQQLRNDLLKKKYLTVSEIISLQVLPVTSKQSIRKWIESGKIKSTEFFLDESGVIKISINFLNRNGYV